MTFNDPNENNYLTGLNKFWELDNSWLAVENEENLLPALSCGNRTRT